jgi:hypothetical protein
MRRVVSRLLTAGASLLGADGHHRADGRRRSRGRRRAPRSASSTSPVARLRQSATPCQSGVAHARAWRTAGAKIGKKVPEKRKRERARSGRLPRATRRRPRSSSRRRARHRTRARTGAPQTGPAPQAGDEGPADRRDRREVVTAIDHADPHHVRIPATSSGPARASRPPRGMCAAAAEAGADGRSSRSPRSA